VLIEVERAAATSRQGSLAAAGKQGVLQAGGLLLGRRWWALAKLGMRWHGRQPQRQRRNLSLSAGRLKQAPIVIARFVAAVWKSRQVVRMLLVLMR
jgi:hypothetical protein